MIRAVEAFLFGHRPQVIGAFVLATLAMAILAAGLRVEASFSKRLPLDHPFMDTYTRYQSEFGGADRVLVALVARDGNMFAARFFSRLEALTDEIFFIPGVDRGRIRSLFTPNVRFTEIVEDGISAGNVIPSDFRADREGLAIVRDNIIKAGLTGHLVANDFSGAAVLARLHEFDPRTGERLDYLEVARLLEERIRDRFSDEHHDVHIIGFAKAVGDIAGGVDRVVLFFGLTLLITSTLVFLYTQSLAFTVLPIACSLIAVIWQLGIVAALGYGIDPMSVLVPFLVFAIGVSHAVQMVSAARAEIFFGHDAESAARRAFRRLAVPGTVALASDTAGFLTILLIGISMIQEMAIMASLGVAVVLLTNLVLLPVLLSLAGPVAEYRSRIDRRAEQLHALWRGVAAVARPRPALAVIAVAAALAVLGISQGADVAIGDSRAGIPELREDSRYNRDSRVFTSRFDVGVDALTVIVETVPQGCVDYQVMRAIDDFRWHMENVPGIHSTMSLPAVAKHLTAAWNEGSLKWRVLPRNRDALAQAVAQVPTGSGLLNSDCSAMPVILFTADHRAETITRIVDAIRAYDAHEATANVSLSLAAGNVGVMAATNDVVAAAQYPILGYVFGAVIVLCLVSFRSVRATLCIVLPLALVSLLTYALMSVLDIGLKISTLPVVALGVGIGVDYGIYIYSRLRGILAMGEPLAIAYEHTLRIAGSGVVLTAVTLAAGVATWIFAPLKFQADMGILLTFMFVVNMLGAVLLLPALACWLARFSKQETSAIP